MAEIRIVPTLFKDSLGHEYKTQEEAENAQSLINATEEFDAAREKYLYFLAATYKTIDGYPFGPTHELDTLRHEHSYWSISERWGWTAEYSLIEIPKLYFRNDVTFRFPSFANPLEVELVWRRRLPDGKFEDLTFKINELYAVEKNAKLALAQKQKAEHTNRLAEVEKTLKALEGK